jgi:DNA-binding XRE family transcriptional regulator
MTAPRNGWKDDPFAEVEVMTRAEVAKALGISRQAVEQAEKRGLAKVLALKSAFEEYL